MAIFDIRSKSKRILSATLTIALLSATGAWRAMHPPVSPRLENAIISAKSYLDRGYYLLAASRFRRALSLDPRNKEAEGLYKIIRVTGFPYKRYSPAFSLQRAKAAYPRYSDSPYMNMIAGEQYRLNGDTAAAIKLHLQAAAIDPALPHNWLLLGLAYRAAGRYPDAVKAFEHAVRQHPEGRYAFALGQQYLFDGADLKAIEAYNLALQDEPHRIDARIGIIRSLIKSGRRKEALERARALSLLLISGNRDVRYFARRGNFLKGGPKFGVVNKLTNEDVTRYVDSLIAWLDSGKQMTFPPRSTDPDNDTEALEQILTFDFDNNPS